jgi:hypothetical protein
MMLHFVLQWPQEAKIELWPFAVDYAVWIWNHLPNTTTRLSPIEIFTKATFPDHKHLQRTRVFGCPVYVLDPTLQDAKKLPKWQKRSWKGKFLGFSPNHHTNVSLVLNPETGSITHQFHVVFDEKFSSISSNINHDSAPALQQWSTLLDDGYDKHEAVPTQQVHPTPATDPPPSPPPNPPVPPETAVRIEAPALSLPESSPFSVKSPSESTVGMPLDHEIPHDVSVQDIMPTINSDEVPTPFSPVSAPDMVTPPVEANESGMSSPPPRHANSVCSCQKSP